MKSIIFDLDGTLLHTLEDLGDCVNQVMRELGFPEYDYESIRSFIGNGSRMLVQRALPPESSETVIDQALESFRQVYARGWKNKSRPFAGVLEALAELKTRGMLLAVLSNKPHAFTVQCTETLLGSGFFTLMQGQEEGIPLKPDPTGLLYMLKRLQLSPEEVVFVGDSPEDMLTATAAGVRAVGVDWGYRDRQELLEHGAEIVLTTPAQLLQLECQFR